MIRIGKIVSGLLISVFILAGCSTGESDIPAFPISSPIAKPQAPSPTSTPVLSTGPDVNMIYLADGVLQRYNFHDHAKEVFPIQSEGEIDYAVLSSDQQWIAYLDQTSLKMQSMSSGVEPAILETCNGSCGRMVFNNSNSILAYSDSEGLKIVQIADRSKTLLFEHHIDSSDVSESWQYFPIAWSPDDQWLWIGVRYWEDFANILYHLPSGSIHHFDACHSEPLWLPGEEKFLSVISYSGYYLCGDNPGIYMFSVDQNGTITQEQIYSQASAAYEHVMFEPLMRSGDKEFSFIEEGYHDSMCRLMVFSTENKQVQELDASNMNRGICGIQNTIWSPDGKWLIYVKEDAGTNQFIRLDVDSGQKAGLAVPKFYDITKVRWIQSSNYVLVDTTAIGKTSPQEPFLINVLAWEIIAVPELSGTQNILDFEINK